MPQMIGVVFWWYCPVCLPREADNKTFSSLDSSVTQHPYIVEDRRQLFLVK